VFEDDLMLSLSRENSREFQDVPQATCEDCLYGIKEWKEQQEILGKTNSFHERELKTLKAPCGALKPEQRYLNQETNMDDKLCQDNIKDKEERQELLPDESDIKQSDQCKSFISVVPHIVLSGTWVITKISKHAMQSKSSEQHSYLMLKDEVFLFARTFRGR
jgi:hypothetical protein